MWYDANGTLQQGMARLGEVNAGTVWQGVNSMIYITVHYFAVNCGPIQCNYDIIHHSTIRYK